MQQFLRPPGPRVATAQPLAALPLTDAACPLRASGTRGKRSWSNASLHPDDLRTIRHGTAVSISQKTQACPKARQNRSRHRYADPRTATLHTRAKLRPKAAFSFGPSTARFLFRKTEKKMGGGMGRPPTRLDSRVQWDAPSWRPLRRRRDVLISIPDGSAVPRGVCCSPGCGHSRPPRRSPSGRGHASGSCR